MVIGRVIQTIQILRKHPALLVLQVVLVGLAGAWIGVYAWDGVRSNLKLITVRAAFEPGLRGGTEIAVPPFGSIKVNTHSGPLRLALQLDQLHVGETLEWLKQRKTPQEAADYLESESTRIASRLISGTLIVALIGAAVACLLLGVRWPYKLIGTIVGVASVAVSLFMLIHTFDKSAFSNPTYEGELSRAPYVLDVVQQGYTSIVENLPNITKQVVDLYRQLETNGSTPALGKESDQRVLLISDLHNNPLGLKFALNLVKSYRVGLVLVAGDITDYGHPLEGDLLTNWASFRVPVYFITGNHDSRAVAEVLSGIPGVTELQDGRLVKDAGLTIIGYGDPAARRDGIGNVNSTPQDLASLTRRIIRDLKKRTDPPDVIMVHNFRVARNIAGHAPVIVTGHSHSAAIEDRKGSTIINTGTTGAAGLRYFTSGRDISHTAVVLHFSSQGSQTWLSGVDLIELQQPSGDFIVSRRNIAAPDVTVPDGGESSE